MKKLSLITIASLLSAVAAQAQIAWTGDAGNGLWSDTLNWTDGNVPDTNLEVAQYGLSADVSINVDQNFTINKFIDGFAGAAFTPTLEGTGTLTLDVNSSAATAIAIDNATGPDGGTLRFNGKVTINNSGTAVTIIRNTNSPGNVVLFDTGSVLTLQTIARTSATGTALGSLIQMNGTLAASAAELQIGSNNVSFGPGHNSSAFGQSIAMLAGSKVAVDGGTVLSTGTKFQVNGNGAELELNGADTINDANLTVGGTNNFLLDVNADQTNMGALIDIGATLTIDLAPTVAELAFNNSSANEAAWVGGTITLINFRNKVIRFGTDNTGLTATQLAQFGAGFFLDAEGYLQNNSFPDPTVINVSLEQSTDLINWTPADEGAYLVYPGEGLFFRARIEPAL